MGPESLGLFAASWICYISAAVLEVVKDSPEIFAGVVAFRIAYGDGGIGHPLHRDAEVVDVGDGQVAVPILYGGPGWVWFISLPGLPSTCARCFVCFVMGPCTLRGSKTEHTKHLTQVDGNPGSILHCYTTL